jgi:hypothetical protein
MDSLPGWILGVQLIIIIPWSRILEKLSHSAGENIPSYGTQRFIT